MQNSNRQSLKPSNTSNKPKLRARSKLAICLLFAAYLAMGIVLVCLTLTSQAHAQSIFSWFSSNDESQQHDLLQDKVPIPVINEVPMHNAAFGELVYHYFQQDYQQVLLLIAVGNEKHGFSELSQEDTDRLNLMQGAAQFQVGLYKSSQAKFARLLSQTTSDYVQANTWFFMAKAGFENKQAYLSERAYEAILQGDLREILSDAQWNELLYLTAYIRMERGQDWQSLQNQIPEEEIYTAYLLANHATLLFNKADYEQSTDTFVKAKRALTKYKNRIGLLTQLGTSVFDTLSWVSTPWRWFDDNATAQQAIKARQEAQNIQEQDALFDRINIGLGQSLLQQGDLGDAMAVLATVANVGVESEQALLTFGWANAKEYQWQTAMESWQHLQQNSTGLFSLQASYGLAYAFSQQNNLGQAFYALQTTANQIDSNVVALETFAVAVQQDEFFARYNEQWPNTLDDLKLGFFAPSQTFNATYLLSMRQQAESMLGDISDKQNRVLQLDSLLVERQATYRERLQGMSLGKAKNLIEQTQQHIDDLHTLIVKSDTFEKQLALSKLMTNEVIASHVSRLEHANARHARLAADTSQKRPVKASYKDRLNRIEGILSWQLMDNFIAQQWQHKKLLKQAQQALTQANLQYDNLQTITQNQKTFSAQHKQFASLNKSLNTQVIAANKVYELSTKALTQRLLSIIETRKAQLQEQGVNTRLAMLRIQDLQQQGGQ